MARMGSSRRSTRRKKIRAVKIPKIPKIGLPKMSLKVKAPHVDMSSKNFFRKSSGYKY